MSEPMAETRYSFSKSAERVKEGAAWLTHGVGSDFRFGMSPHPLVFERADGPYLYDVDGNRLIDYYLGMGPMILGHRPAVVVDAVRDALDTGILFGGQSELEYDAARLICELVPGAESVRFTSSGSEAVQAALRLARGATGRWTVLKFEGHYHGWFDNVLVSHAPPADQLGSPDAPARSAGTAGQDLLAAERIAVMPWNDLERLVGRLEQGDVAAVIMEPAMCNTGAVPPAPEYLEGVRETCDRTGTVLVFDEVITGFRLSRAGAQGLFGVTPDLTTFGKALASGFPVAALAGRRELMEKLTRAAGGSVMHAGTYNGGIPAMAATVASLRVLSEPRTHALLEESGRRLMEGLARALGDAGVEHRIQGWPSIFHLSLGTSDEITDYRSSLAADKERYARLCAALLERGVRLLERGAWFLSTTHTADVVDETLDAFADALPRS